MSDVQSFTMTKPAPMIWCHAISPRPERTVNGEKFPAGYEATFLFPADHPDLAEIKKLLGATAAGFDKFAEKIAGNKAAGRSPYDGLKFPLENGTKMADAGKAKDRDREFLRGAAVFKAKSNVAKRDGTPLSPPRLLVLNHKTMKYDRYSDEHERPLAKKFFYSGVLAIGTFNFVPYAGMGGGVSAYLNEILSLNAGDPIATGADDEAKYGSPDKFSGYVGKVSAEDPTVGMDDEIPF